MDAIRQPSGARRAASAATQSQSASPIVVSAVTSSWSSPMSRSFIVPSSGALAADGRRCRGMPPPAYAVVRRLRAGIGPRRAFEGPGAWLGRAMIRRLPAGAALVVGDEVEVDDPVHELVLTRHVALGNPGVGDHLGRVRVAAVDGESLVGEFVGHGHEDAI